MLFSAGIDSKSISGRLEFTNNYLDFHLRKSILYFVMIYFYQIKNTTTKKNDSLINSLTILVSKYKSTDYITTKKDIRKILLISNNPVVFFRKIIS